VRARAQPLPRLALRRHELAALAAFVPPLSRRVTPNNALKFVALCPKSQS